VNDLIATVVIFGAFTWICHGVAVSLQRKAAARSLCIDVDRNVVLFRDDVEWRRWIVDNFKAIRHDTVLMVPTDASLTTWTATKLVRPVRVVDGELATYTETITTTPARPWWLVDLRQP